MDYSSIDEVAKAIMKYDSNLGMSFYNLPTYISNAFSEGSDLKKSNYEDPENSLERLALKSALEALLILKENEKNLADEKTFNLYYKLCDICGEDPQKWEESEADGQFHNAANRVLELAAECEEIKRYIRLESDSFA